ncbi:hypothetical protein V6Z11_A06G169200 [Gossypium hirsutum]
MYNSRATKAYKTPSKGSKLKTSICRHPLLDHHKPEIYFSCLWFDGCWCVGVRIAHNLHFSIFLESVVLLFFELHLSF